MQPGEFCRFGRSAGIAVLSVFGLWLCVLFCGSLRPTSAGRLVCDWWILRFLRGLLVSAWRNCFVRRFRPVSFERRRVCWFGFVLLWTGFGWRIRGCCAVGGGGRLLGDGEVGLCFALARFVLLSVLDVRRGSG